MLLQRQLLRDQLAEHQARIGTAQHLIDQRQAALDQTKENIRRLEATVPMGEELAETIKKLLDQNAATKLEFIQAEQQRIDKTQELAGQRKKLKQDQSALSEAETNYRALVSEFQQTKQVELSTLEVKASSLTQDVTKAGQKADLQRLTTPIDGVVQQLAVHTVGGVVTPAQELLIVVPQDHPVEVAAQVENKDVGFVKNGQIVEIKVETFPFTLYGTIPGTVLSVSDDAAPIDKGRTGLSHPGQHGPLHHRRGGKAGQSVTRHGGHRRDQDRPAPRDRISLESVSEIYEGKPERAMNKLLIYKICLRSQSQQFPQSFLHCAVMSPVSVLGAFFR